MIRPQALQAAGTCRLHPGAGGIMRIDLGHHEGPGALSSQGVADDLLGSTVGIHFGGVDQGHAQIQPEAQRIGLSSAAGGVFTHIPGALPEHRHGAAIGQVQLAHQPARVSARRSSRMKLPPHSAAIWLGP